MTSEPTRRCPAHCILPPHLLRHIARNGNERQRALADRALAVDPLVRERRAELRPTRRAVRRIPAVAPAEAPVPAKDRRVFDAKEGTDLPGQPVRAEGDPPSGDVAVDEAFDGLGATWDLYQQVFSRSSYDDAGAPLVGSVHFGRDYDNAFWNGTQMVFGDGDGVLFNRFTVAVDVLGHELTHAVTDDESQLAYRGQSGALNESLSDVFGSLVKQWSASPQQSAADADWLIGAGLLATGVNGVALRSMRAPGTAYDDPVLGKDPQPAHVDHYVDTDEDSGGVHINSGIPNHAFYLVATALGGFAWERAGRIWYAAATDQTLAPDCGFHQFAELTAVHAAALGPAEHRATVDAWSQVGVDIVGTRDINLSLATGAPRATGRPFGYDLAGQGVQNVVYRGTDGHVHGIWRAVGAIGRDDLTRLSGASAAVGDPRAYVDSGRGFQTVLVPTSGGSLDALWWAAADVGRDDLTALAQAPRPVGSAHGYVFGTDDVQNAAYRGADGHLHGLWWTTGQVGHDDLTALSGAPVPAGDPTGYVAPAYGVQVVVYRGVDGHVHGLYWSTGAVGHDDLTRLAGAPRAVGDPAAWYRAADASQHVVFRTADGHLHELWWTTGAVGHGDLMAVFGGPLAAGNPTAYVTDADGVQHVVYRDAAGHLHELWWSDTASGSGDLTATADAALAAGDPHGFVRADGSQHIVYRSTDGHVHELTWR